MAKAKILGKLKGIIASAREASRNGRKYTERFWDTKFNDPLFKEGLECKVMLGELYHPDNEEEYNQIHCDDRSAIVLTDVKKKGLDYEGTFDILPTKAGQCLRNLLDIGCVFGISSRGLADYDTSVFDENMASNYDLITWDIVAFPGVKCCRLHEVGAVAENFNYNKVNKIKIMENLKTITSNNEELKNYVDETLKLKEDFDDKLHVEDLAVKYNIPDDLEDDFNANIVKIGDDHIVYHDDGIHGNKQVFSPVGLTDKLKDLDNKIGDQYFVDNIAYRPEIDAYIATGEWIKL